MEHRQQAEELYKQTRCYNLEETNHLPEIKEYLRHFVCRCPPLQKFNMREIPEIIIKSAKEATFISIKASQAFEKLEYYFSLVYSNPWKAEFHTIKKYSGFFQTKIASHLTGVDSLLKKVGYTENQHRNEFNWTSKMNRDIILAIAFECLIASVECLIIHEIQLRTKFSIAAIQVVSIRSSNSGDVDDTYNLLRKIHNLKKDCDNVLLSPGHTKPMDHVDQLSPRQPVNKSQLGSVTNVEHDVRNDGQGSEFREGTLDDHLMASMQLIEEEQSPTIKQPSVRPSDEWSFVEEGLRKKYGEKYYEGQRGNILTPSSKESKLYRDSGIGSGLPSDHPYGVASGILSEQPYGDPDTFKTRSARKLPQSVAHAQVSWPTNPEQLPLHRSQYSWPVHEPNPPPVHRPQFSSPFPQGQATTKTEPLKTRNQSLTSMYPPDQWLPKQTLNPNIIEQSNDEDIEAAIRPSRSITKTDFVPDPSSDSTAAPVYSRISKGVVKDNLPSSGHCQPFNFGRHSAPVARKEPEERISSSSLGEEETWICNHCTMKNRCNTNTCTVCSKSRDKARSPDVRWGKRCSRCTLINNGDAYSCEACSNKLPDACDIVQ